MPGQRVFPVSPGAEPPAAADFANHLFKTGEPSLENLPGPRKLGPYEDEAALLKVFRDFRKEAFDGRQALERIWWQKLLYYSNRQWIYYTRTGQWEDKRLQRWVPRPVTNKIAEAVDSIESVFKSVRLQANVRPFGQDAAAVNTADLATRLEPAIRFEHEMSRVLELTDFWHILLGNVFWHPWWNKTAGERIQATMLLCGQCGWMGPQEGKDTRCPQCQQETKVMPPQEGLNVGRGETDVCSPFEIAFPAVYSDFDKLPGLIRMRWRPKRWFEDTDPENAKTLRWEHSSTEQSIQHLLHLSHQVEQSPGAQTEASGTPSETEGITEYELWLKPCRAYPEGLLARAAGGEGAEKLLKQPSQSIPGPLPYRDQQDRPLFPWCHGVYIRHAGRIWGTSPVDRAIQKQDQINQLDSLMQMMAQRTSNPVWLRPKGSEITKMTGEPGLIIDYPPQVGGQSGKPERIAGETIPPALMRLREQYLADLEAVFGTYDIIKGAKPTGVEAFSALQLLVERSQSRFGPALEHRADLYRRWYQLALELERTYGPVERTWSVLSPNGRWVFEVFKAADLQGSILVEIEDGSQMPKTSLGKRASVQQLDQMGMLDKDNPDTKYHVLSLFGATDLHPGLDVSVKRALQEQYEWEQWAAQVQIAPPPPIDPMMPPMGPLPLPQTSIPMPGERLPGIHDDFVHLLEHRKWANGDAIAELLKGRPELVPFLVKFVRQHDEAMMAQQAAQAAAAGAPGAPPGSPGAGQALSSSNREAGNPADVPRGAQGAPAGQNPVQGPA